MENKLTMEHLACYLPFRLKIAYYFNDHKVCESPMVAQMTSNSYAGEIPIGAVLDGSGDFKPVLKPLSWLTKEIEHNEERFVPSEKIQEIRKGVSIYKPLSERFPLEINVQTEDYTHEVDLYDGYLIMQKLFEWKFDVFSLIPQGLAIEEGGQS